MASAASCFIAAHAALAAAEACAASAFARAAALKAPNIPAILGAVYTGSAQVREISVYGLVIGLAAPSGRLGGILIRADVAGPDPGPLGW